MKYYFAYGSNMNPERMKKRGVNFFEKFSGKLPCYRFTFQEFTKIGNSYANIVEDVNSNVEGIVYEVDDSVDVLDKYEHVPINYFREEKEIHTTIGKIRCIVYIGNQKNLGKELRPEFSYFYHIKKGKEFLTKEYYENLLEYFSCLEL